MTAESVQGYLQLKQVGNLGDSWKNFACEFIPATKALKIKSKDGQFVHWEHEVEKAWALEAKSFRRANRFDVKTSDGLTCAFSAPSDTEMQEWIEVLSRGKLPSSSLVPTGIREIMTIGEETPVSGNEFLSVFGAEDAEEEEEGAAAQPSVVFDIAGDEADSAEKGTEKLSPKDEVLLTSKIEDITPAASPAPAAEEELSPVGHVMRWFSGEEEALIEAPKEVSQADNEAEVALEAADLAVQGEDAKDEPVQTTYQDITELLVTHHLGQFVIHFHHHGIDTIAELRGCTDAFLQEQLNMKKAHVLKFRRALRDAGEKAAAQTGGKLSVWEAVDGYRGTYEEVCAHEAKLERLSAGKGSSKGKFSLYEAPDGFRGTYEEVAAHERKHGLATQEEKEESSDAPIFSLYEASDGFRGSYDDVVAHEGKMKSGVSDDSALGPVIARIYEATDGFRGSYDDVIAHEDKIQSGLTGGDFGLSGNKQGDVIARIYEATDGFRGSYEDVIAHEDKIQSGLTGGDFGMGDSNQGPVIARIYEATDGFRGSYDDVIAHEGKIQSGLTGGDFGLSGNKQGDVIARIYEATDGYRGSYDDVIAHEDLLASTKGSSGETLFRLYEAPDGFRGSYEEVVKHERENGQAENALHSLFESSDGKFKGTYDECLAYEEANGLVDSEKHGIAPHAAQGKLYEASDGKFRGTYEECVAYEEANGLVDSEKHAIAPHVSQGKLYEAADGKFRGTYEECVAYEEANGLVDSEQHGIAPHVAPGATEVLL